MTDSSTAVTRNDAQTLPAAAQGEIDQIRQQGMVAVERQKTLNEFSRQIAGLTWGSGNNAVSGSTLSSAVRYAIAELCTLSGANPILHTEILGGKVYFNSLFYQERMQSDPHHIEYLEKNISALHQQQLRSIAEQADADGDPEEARELRREARQIARLRSHYGVPEWATHAYEGTAVRYSEGAPMDGIHAGRIDGTPFIQRISDANWAGGRPKQKKDGRNGPYEFDPDPVGNAEPGKTAQTRTMRRVGKRAYPSFLTPEQDAAIEKLENAIEAEFEDITEQKAEARAALPATGERQAARIGSGEPSAAKAADAQPLPKREAKPRAAAQLPADAQAERDRYVEGCKVLGIDPAGSMMLAAIGGRTPETVEDFRALNQALAAIADSGGAE